MSKKPVPNADRPTNKASGTERRPIAAPSARAAPVPTPRAASASRYAPHPPPFPIDLHLDANEGVAPAIDLAAIVASLGQGVRRYPTAASLQAALGDRLGVNPTRVMVTAGGDEVIDRACRAYLEPGRELILPVPTFEMIPRYAALAGATVRRVPWAAGAFPIDAVLSQVTQSTAMIAVVSPNNPTGAIASAADLRRLSAAAPHALLLVDLAYTEFADHDLTPDALALPNALVIRTFSKAFGLAGLRVGYAIGHEPIINTLRAVAGPFPVSSVSLAIAGAALASAPTWMPGVVARVREERRELALAIGTIGGRAGDSQGNFVLAEFDGVDTGAIWRALASRGIAVRRVNMPRPGEPSAPTPQPNALRITCPASRAAMDRLLPALRDSVKEAQPA